MSPIHRLASLTLLALVSCTSTPRTDRPNIVLIVSDDQGWDDVSCYGGSVPTPWIDSIARDGARLTDFYVASPVCTPSRFSLLTGRLPNRSRDQLLGPLMFAEGRDRTRGIRPGETTLAALLKTRGYRTALVGKWHLGHGDPAFLPTRHGFDSFYGHTGGCIDYHTLRYGNLPSWYRGEELVEESGYATDLLSDEAVRFLEGQSAEQPFFLYLAYNAPHFAKSWDEGKRDFAHTLQAKPEDLASFAHVEDEDRRVFCAMVKAMDDGIGRVLAALDRRGLAGDTLVVFICDNGADPVYGGSNSPLRGRKHTLWEGGIRVPCVMRWPGRIASGTTVDQPASALDFVPTVCALLDIETDGLPLDGIDLGPVLLDGKRVERDLFFERGFDAAFRRGDWKLVRDRDAPPALFNLRDDRSETRDLAARRPEKLAELLAAHAEMSAGLPEPRERPFAPRRGRAESAR